MSIAAVQEREIPAEISEVGMPAPDYVDLFTAPVRAGADASAEEWARTTMEGASPQGRFLAWQVLCGLRLATATSPDHIAGWRIVERGESWIRLEAQGSFMSANIVFRVDDGRVSFATFVRYERRVGALIWGTVSPVHRAVAPGFVANGVRLMERSRS
jgi:hypothetical protein